MKIVGSAMERDSLKPLESQNDLTAEDMSEVSQYGLLPQRNPEGGDGEPQEYLLPRKELSLISQPELSIYSQMHE